METIKVLRGFRDIYGEEIERFNLIERASRTYLHLLGYREISIPVLEKTELFKRSIGDTTDIVEKEMFTFTDRSGESVTMRPEATAGIVRAYLQEGLHARERVSRLFTIGPMFRHERPQKGRFRQFHQANVEVFGMAEPLLEAELLWLISLILKELAVEKYVCEVNTVGCRSCRQGFRDVLLSYFSDRRDRLCEDCLGRLERNPLRIFDCKNPGCISITQESPFLYDYLCEGCRSHFETFLARVSDFGVPVTVNKRLVRGLDYYTRTVFEVTSSELGAQKAFAAGGRYDNLVEEMGGPATPGCGFAIGVERLSLLITRMPPYEELTFFLATVGSEAEAFKVPLLRAFADRKLRLLYGESKSLKSQMKRADAVKADYVLIVGEQELARRALIMRNMKDGSQKEIRLDIATLPDDVLAAALEANERNPLP